jgi:hypothetical protein
VSLLQALEDPGLVLFCALIFPLVAWMSEARIIMKGDDYGVAEGSDVTASLK